MVPVRSPVQRLTAASGLPVRDGHIELCHVDDVEDGESLGVDPLGEGRDSLFVVRRGGRVHVYHNLCPHQGSTLPWRKNEFLNGDGSRIVCHAHGAQFDIETGRCTLGAALGQSLAKVDISIGRDGIVRAREPDVRRRPEPAPGSCIRPGQTALKP